jgi:4-amino-4-deoxy-L-arabinose transferase-like glycosyltransferase
VSAFGFLQSLIVQVLTVLAFGLEVFALADAMRTRADAFYVAGKQTKNRWLLILGVATALGFVSLPLFGGGRLDPFGLLPIVAVVAAGVYLADVRPAVRQIRGGGGGGGPKSGPYGPW